MTVHVGYRPAPTHFSILSSCCTVCWYPHKVFPGTETGIYVLWGIYVTKGTWRWVYKKGIKTLKSAFEPGIGHYFSLVLKAWLRVFLLPLGWNAIPLQGLLVKHLISWHPFIHLGGERCCLSKVKNTTQWHCWGLGNGPLIWSPVH